jgi:hypothetical protein
MDRPFALDPRSRSRNGTTGSSVKRGELFRFVKRPQTDLAVCASDDVET